MAATEVQTTSVGNTGPQAVQNNKSELDQLKEIAKKALQEHEELKKKYEESQRIQTLLKNQLVFKEQELIKIHNVSEAACDEFAEIKAQLEVEQLCREEAESYATKMVKQNKSIKRKSAAILGNKWNSIEISLDDDDDDPQVNSSLESEQQRLNELRDELTALRKDLDVANKDNNELNEEMITLKHELEQERISNSDLKDALKQRDRAIQQFSRVSTLVVNEFEEISENYEKEALLRKKAESFAAKMYQEKKVVAEVARRQSQILLDPPDDKFTQAMKEIEELNSMLEKTETQEKIQPVNSAQEPSVNDIPTSDKTPSDVAIESDSVVADPNEDVSKDDAINQHTGDVKLSKTDVSADVSEVSAEMPLQSGRNGESLIITGGSEVTDKKAEPDEKQSSKPEEPTSSNKPEIPERTVSAVKVEETNSSCNKEILETNEEESKAEESTEIHEETVLAVKVEETMSAIKPEIPEKNVEVGKAEEPKSSNKPVIPERTVSAAKYEEPKSSNKQTEKNVEVGSSEKPKPSSKPVIPERTVSAAKVEEPKSANKQETPENNEEVGKAEEPKSSNKPVIPERTVSAAKSEELSKKPSQETSSKLSESNDQMIKKILTMMESITDTETNNELNNTEDKDQKPKKEYVHNLENKLSIAQEENECLEQQISELQDELKKVKIQLEVAAEKLRPPPPPPPPPLPTVKHPLDLLKKILKKSPDDKKDKDPLQEKHTALIDEMMNRIKKGRVGLKPVNEQPKPIERGRSSKLSRKNTHTPAFMELNGLLKKNNKNQPPLIKSSSESDASPELMKIMNRRRHKLDIEGSPKENGQKGETAS
ncbi:uncharacterized protein [Antedon mediterranea]|uniref:uncharacterized protein isoform X2 n=1 Tax=Antedon mediterranea TaxID=105859 RepID=UPI003AF78147